jgi:hypothetical protein
MRKHARSKSGIDRRGSDVAGRYRSFRGSTLRAYELKSHLAGFQLSAGYGRCQCVQNAMLRSLYDREWKIAIARSDHVSRQPSRDIPRCRTLLCKRRRVLTPKRSGRHQAADTLQYPSSPHERTSDPAQWYTANYTD